MCSKTHCQCGDNYPSIEHQKITGIEAIEGSSYLQLTLLDGSFRKVLPRYANMIKNTQEKLDNSTTDYITISIFNETFFNG